MVLVGAIFFVAGLVTETFTGWGAKIIAFVKSKI